MKNDNYIILRLSGLILFSICLNFISIEGSATIARQGIQTGQKVFTNARTTQGARFFSTGSDDIYSILGLSRNATDAELKAARIKYTQSQHPDKFPDPNQKIKATENMKKMNAAWDEKFKPNTSSSTGSTRNSTNANNTNNSYRSNNSTNANTNNNYSSNSSTNNTRNSTNNTHNSADSDHAYHSYQRQKAEAEAAWEQKKQEYKAAWEQEKRRYSSQNQSHSNTWNAGTHQEHKNPWTQAEYDKFWSDYEYAYNARPWYEKLKIMLRTQQPWPNFKTVKDRMEPIIRNHPEMWTTFKEGLNNVYKTQIPNFENVNGAITAAAALPLGLYLASHDKQGPENYFGDDMYNIHVNVDPSTDMPVETVNTEPSILQAPASTQEKSLEIPTPSFWDTFMNSSNTLFEAGNTLMHDNPMTSATIATLALGSLGYYGYQWYNDYFTEKKPVRIIKKKKPTEDKNDKDTAPTTPQ